MSKSTRRAPFEGHRTYTTALLLAALGWLHSSGVIELSGDQLAAVAGTIAGGALWFLRSAVHRLSPELARLVLDELARQATEPATEDEPAATHELHHQPFRPKPTQAGFSRPLTLAVLSLVALLLMGCLGGMVDRVRRPNSSVELTNERMIAVSSSEQLGTQDLAGDVFLAQIGELEMPVVCVGETRSWCRDVDPLDELWLEHGLLKSGHLQLGCNGRVDADGRTGCRTYTTYIEVSQLRQGIRGKAF